MQRQAPPCADGGYPNGALILDTEGNLYGTTYDGGTKSNGGLVFKLSPVPGHAKWKLTPLYDFISGGSDGASPAAGLTYEGARSGARYDGVSPLYGTTEVGGGGTAEGTVFSITPVPGKAQWKEKILHAFANEGTLLVGGLTFDASGSLFGTALTGGSSTFAGTIFELSPNARKTRWTTTVLHNFCATFVCDDGAQPFATIAMDASGSLFGTTTMGGSGNNGVVFKLAPNGENSQLTVLYNFCAQPNCADGRDPGDGNVGPLAIDAYGNLFGTTRYGDNGGANGFGVVYELSGATQTVLYSFCAEANCTDGWFPSSGLLLDGSNNLIGTTDYGGAYAAGTIYELTP